MDDSSPAARALLALEAIQSMPGLTNERLAARLGVTDRAARRYVAVLRQAGIPVESTPGRYGGYRIGRGTRVPLTFGTAEALGLVMAVLQGWHGSMTEDHPAATALRKIVRVLPAAAAAPAEALRQVRGQNPGDAATMPDPALTAEIAQACERSQTARLEYRAGPKTRRWTVDPWAVVVRHGRWYLLCWSHAARERRVLRLDRILSFAPDGASFARPDGLDAVQVVEEHLAEGWTHRVELRIACSRADAIPWLPRLLGRLTAVDERTCVLRGSTDNPDWYAAQLALLPYEFTVVADDSLREEVSRLARRMARAARTPRRSRPTASA